MKNDNLEKTYHADSAAIHAAIRSFLTVFFPERSHLDAVIHIGSTVNFNHGFVNDVDLIAIFSANINRRTKKYIHHEGFIFDLTVFESKEIEKHLVMEAFHGHFDVSGGISSGTPIYVGSDRWKEIVGFANKIIENGQTHYTNSIYISKMRISLARLIKKFDDKLEKDGILFLMSSYQLVYECFMTSKGLWRCSGAFRQLRGSADSCFFQQVYREAVNGEPENLKNLIDDLLRKLGGSLHDKSL